MHRGRLVGHNGAVCALAARNNLMATGARDRLIKVRQIISCIQVVALDLSAFIITISKKKG